MALVKTFDCTLSELVPEAAILEKPLVTLDRIVLLEVAGMAEEVLERYGVHLEPKQKAEFIGNLYELTSAKRAVEPEYKLDLTIAYWLLKKSLNYSKYLKAS